MCTVLLPPGVNPNAVDKYIIVIEMKFIQQFYLALHVTFVRIQSKCVENLGTSKGCS